MRLRELLMDRIRSLVVKRIQQLLPEPHRHHAEQFANELSRDEPSPVDYRNRANKFVENLVAFMRDYSAEPKLQLDYQRILTKDWKRSLKEQQNEVSSRLHQVTDTDCGIRCIDEKCTSTSVEYKTMQLRAADEPETTFYECKKCGKRWNDKQ